jgi:hypothetical protein
MAVEQGIAVSVSGGLDKTSSSYELFKAPGAATRLKNFESSIHGGYRRVNGYRKFLSSPVISFTITDGGVGYAAGTTIAITDSEGNGAAATATVTVTSGVITAVTLTNGGSGYQIPPDISFAAIGTGVTTKAVIVANLNATVTPSGATTPIKGIHAHDTGGWACQGGSIYWSENGYSWLKVNKDNGSCSTGASITQQTCEEAGYTWSPAWTTQKEIEALGVSSVVSLDAIGRYEFSEYIPTNVPDTRVSAVNGIDAPVYLETKKAVVNATALVAGETYTIKTLGDTDFTAVGAAHNAAYVSFVANSTTGLGTGTVYLRSFKFHRGLYKSFGMTSPYIYADIPKPKFTETHEDHTIIAGWVDRPETVYYTEHYSDIDYTGESAGYINTGDEITGIKPFRKELVVFGRNSLSKLINISTDVALIDVTKNIGCVDGGSIQEIGGDLVFLAPDGIRTVAATARIDDIELSSISHKIIPVINDIVNNIHRYDISSVVIRTQNQYRLFYCNSTTSTVAQKGVIGTFKISAQGVPLWEWSELQGVEVSTLTSEFDSKNIEQAYHGDYNGFIHLHNKGNHFDGSNIRAEFKTPDIDYGDIGIRKTLHNIKLSIKPEGETNIKLDLRFDFEDPEISQPATFDLGAILTPSLFGSALFGTSKFGTPEIPMKRVNLWGSGFSNSFRFSSNDTNPPYSIQGMYVDLIPSGRR